MGEVSSPGQWTTAHGRVLFAGFPVQEPEETAKMVRVGLYITTSPATKRLDISPRDESQGYTERKQ